MKTAMVFGLIFLIATALAQEPDASFRGMVRLNRAPVSNDVLKVKLPRPVERQLSNGLRLVILESHRTPSIALTISVPSNNLRDGATPGLSEATAALMMLGATTKTARQISEALADLGATVNFGSGGGGGGRGGGGAPAGSSATVTVNSLTENFDAALALASDILLHPSFPADEFEKWKTRQRSQLEQSRTQPNALSSEALMRALYPNDGRQFTRLTLDSLSKLTRENLIEHYKRYYVPSGELAGISGDITPRDAVAKLEKYFAQWKGGPVARVALPMAAPIAERKVYLVSRPGSVQTSLTLANRAIERTNPDYIACMVMNQVLGSGPAARLFRIIREEKGYTYGVSSSFTATRYLPHFSSSMSVRTEVTEPALADLLKLRRAHQIVAVHRQAFGGAGVTHHHRPQKHHQVGFLA